MSDEEYEFEEEATPTEEESFAEEEVVPEAEPVAVDEIPMSVHVELARVEMNAGELMRLEPGNVIDLKTPVGKAVDLIVGGKCVGKGELIQMGEVLGVRILKK